MPFANLKNLSIAYAHDEDDFLEAKNLRHGIDRSLRKVFVTPHVHDAVKPVNAEMIAQNQQL